MAPQSTKTTRPASPSAEPERTSAEPAPERASAEPRDPSPAVTRSLRILGALERARGPLTLSELAREVGMAKSSASNICQALENEGMIDRVESGYRLGIRTAELGGAFASQFNQVREFFAAVEGDPVLRGHVVQIAMLDAPDALYLARHEGRRQRLGTPLGSRLPLIHCAVGNAMLLAMDDAEVDAVLGAADFAPTTEESVTSPEAVRAKIGAGRERGFAIDRGESFPGIHGVAVPLEPWQPGDPRMAVGVALAASEAGDAVVEELGAALLTLADALTNPLSRRP
ncbi:IclR family transcriptional regulator [Brachybacterium sp. ACRRE]|uniref:IclR family transcriptional regulator n=1 Tax=Brachybacterium sp. ACRRE TaxID=2918184 RepID=UPI001EF2C8A3|nr:IclR family transcriptional regulator [Brachybacterium sp. ACRRE]